MPGDLAPLTFEPLFKARLWGGRRLEELYGKALPEGTAVGESWELVDRPDDQSVVDSGPFEGRTINDLWQTCRRDVFGAAGVACSADRFPLIVKLLDARETLSLQVHPTDATARRHGGAPKSEVWCVAAADRDAVLFAGLRAGVTRERLEAAVASGRDPLPLVHAIPTAPNVGLFVPAGRIHAIGAGNVVLEVSQNSDTTFRVYDFDRRDGDGRKRPLHVDESLSCIDFDDVEPEPSAAEGEIACCESFTVRRARVDGTLIPASPHECAIVTVLSGAIRCGGRTLEPGTVCLVPAERGPRALTGNGTVVIAHL